MSEKERGLKSSERGKEKEGFGYESLGEALGLGEDFELGSLEPLADDFSNVPEKVGKDGAVILVNAFRSRENNMVRLEDMWVLGGSDRYPDGGLLVHQKLDNTDTYYVVSEKREEMQIHGERIHGGRGLSAERSFHIFKTPEIAYWTDDGSGYCYNITDWNLDIFSEDKIPASEELPQHQLLIPLEGEHHFKEMFYSPEENTTNSAILTDPVLFHALRHERGHYWEIKNYPRSHQLENMIRKDSAANLLDKGVRPDELSNMLRDLSFSERQANLAASLEERQLRRKDKPTRPEKPEDSKDLDYLNKLKEYQEEMKAWQRKREQARYDLDEGSEFYDLKKHSFQYMHSPQEAVSRGARKLMRFNRSIQTILACQGENPRYRTDRPLHLTLDGEEFTMDRLKDGIGFSYDRDGKRYIYTEYISGDIVLVINDLDEDGFVISSEDVDDYYLEREAYDYIRSKVSAEEQKLLEEIDWNDHNERISELVDIDFLNWQESSEYAGCEECEFGWKRSSLCIRKDSESDDIIAIKYINKDDDALNAEVTFETRELDDTGVCDCVVLRKGDAEEVIVPVDEDSLDGKAEKVIVELASLEGILEERLEIEERFRFEQYKARIEEFLPEGEMDRDARIGNFSLYRRTTKYGNYYHVNYRESGLSDYEDWTFEEERLSWQLSNGGTDGVLERISANLSPDGDKKLDKVHGKWDELLERLEAEKQKGETEE